MLVNEGAKNDCCPEEARAGPPAMRRNFIRESDRTTAGGVVIEGLPSDVIEGHGVSFDGAQVSCSACKSIGRIRCVDPRLPFTLPNGQKPALENDLCICKCKITPKLVAGQIFSGMEFDAEQLQGMGFDSNGKPLTETAVARAIPPTGADSGLCLACLLKAAAAGSATVIRS